MEKPKLEKININDLEIVKKISVLNTVEGKEDFVNDFINDLVNLVEKSNTKDISNIGRKLQEKYGSDLFDVGGFPYEAFIDNIKKAQVVGVLVEALEKKLPQQQAEYVIHILMKISEDAGERETLWFNEDGRVVGQTHGIHFNQKKLEENKQEFLDSLE
ncbi:hypothetical protein KC929_02755 [Patescibacteria group bacterium]|nr:hypothetical protein [Patescibacteria group bacterium]